MNDLVDPPIPPTRRGVARQIVVSVMLSVLCSVSITLTIVRYGHLTDRKPFQQSGKFRVDPGQVGSVNFPIPYQFPPSVEIDEIDPSSLEKTNITDITTQGFHWQTERPPNPFYNFKNFTLKWTARGVVAHQP